MGNEYSGNRVRRGGGPVPTKRQRLCDESNNARRALDAARLVVGQAEVRFTRSKQAIEAFNKEQVKCKCNTCPTCGKEK